MPIPEIRDLGWRPDLPDIRDQAYKLQRPRGPLPQNVDLREKCPPIVDQGNLGSCTANAIAGMVDFMHVGDKKLHPSSRLQIYYDERVIEDTVSEDAGAYLRDGMKVVKNIGVARETSWKYDVAKFKRRPPKTAYSVAGHHKISSYHRLDTVDEMMECLSEGYPFVFGFSVYNSFFSADTAQSGIVNMPQDAEKLLGGHAVMAIGYDLSANQFIVRNSWGEDWGMRGYFLMPVAYLENRYLSDDFWTARP